MAVLDRLRRGVTTASADETRALAEELAKALPDDITLALHGDLGAGKTTFVQGLARGLGITAPVTSPTYAIFTILRPEATAGGTRIRLLVHLDAYRLESPGQFDNLLLEDFLKTPYCLAVEWPEKIGNRLPATAWHLDLGIAPGQHHTIRLRS